MNQNEQTTVKLPIETKKAVRIVAAELDIPMGKAALELIKIGLEEYRRKLVQQATGNPSYVLESTGPVMGEEAV